MILFNIILGNLNTAPDPWCHIVDETGAHFYEKKDIRQRIRLDKRIGFPANTEREEALTPVYAASNIQCYEPISHVRWVNNNRTMNPMLLKDDYGDMITDPQIVMYLTVSSNYSILNFDCNHTILQTYHKTDAFQGCAIVLTMRDLIKEPNYIRMTVYDRKKQQYLTITIRQNKDYPDRVDIKKKQITNPDIIADLGGKLEMHNGAFLGFKIIPKQHGTMITSLYLVDSTMVDDMKKFLRGINNCVLLQVNSDQLLDRDYMEHELLPRIQDLIARDGYRSITQVGVSMKLEYIRKLRLLYVFDFNISKQRLLCKKSS